MTGFTTFYLILHSINLAGKAAKITNNPVNLSTIPSEYHKFVDIFSKAKAKILASHCFYNLQIKLKNGEKPSIGTIYLLSAIKQEVFKEFICKNLNKVNPFISKFVLINIFFQILSSILLLWIKSVSVNCI